MCFHNGTAWRTDLEYEKIDMITWFFLHQDFTPGSLNARHLRIPCLAAFWLMLAALLHCRPVLFLKYHFSGVETFTKTCVAQNTFAGFRCSLFAGPGQSHNGVFLCIRSAQAQHGATHGNLQVFFFFPFR